MTDMKSAIAAFGRAFWENRAGGGRGGKISCPSLPSAGYFLEMLAIDLFCGLGGWAEGLLAEGWDVVGFDIERHAYGAHRYPAQLVLQDVLTLHGSQFRDAALIVASPPCQAYSWMAMPWKRAKARAAEIRADETGAMLAELNRLFEACFRIQAQASLAAGRRIPLVVENVRGAQPWVGRARWNFGSFYLWGDVPALMPFTGLQQKNPGFRFDGSGRSFQSESVKNKDADGYERTHPAAFGWKAPRTTSGNVSARKAASALIAKIPLALARHVGATYRE